jgi:hypothetical protein
VVGNTEPGGMGGINATLAQLRGDAPNVGGGAVDCIGGVCGPVDEFGNPIGDAVDTGSGYWWPRVAITFVALSALLTFLSTRLVVPAGMRWAFRRRRNAATEEPSGPITVGPSTDPGQATLEELTEPDR